MNVAVTISVGVVVSPITEVGEAATVIGGGAGVGYDGRGNITALAGVGYGFNALNQLTGATVGGTTTGLSYDPADRLYQLGSTRFLYDGPQAIAEYGPGGAVLRRYVPGVGTDQTVVAYEGAGYDRRGLQADERGSVMAITDGAANPLAVNTYDEYGAPGPSNAGRFQYTGQMWLPEAQAYHYKARVYAPQLGRFLQTDPIGYDNGLNLYAYVANDPVNRTDPTGEACIPLVNSSSPFCARSARLAGLSRDVRISRFTTFYEGASHATRGLANMDLPGAGVSRSTYRFLNDVSARLERHNLDQAAAIRSGRVQDQGIVANDRAFVRAEQGLVQGSLDALKQSSPERYSQIVGEINGLLNGTLESAGSMALGDGVFVGALAATKRQFGGVIDFGKYDHRVALGDKLMEALRETK